MLCCYMRTVAPNGTLESGVGHMVKIAEGAPPPLATERFDYRSRAGFQKLIVLIIIARPSQCWNLELGVIAMATV